MTTTHKFGTLEDFAWWIKDKDPQDTYSYLAATKCAVTCYARDRLSPDENVDLTCAGDGTVFVFDEKGSSVVYPKVRLDTRLFDAAARGTETGSFTYASLLEIVKELIAKRS